MPRLLRILAICIAIAAAIDPAITTNRVAKPEIAVIASSADSLLAERVIRTLGNGFVVTRAPLSSADATVIVGDKLPGHPGDLASPAFAVAADLSKSAAVVQAMQLPAWAPLTGSVPVRSIVRSIHAMSHGIRTTLRVNGVVVDQGGDDDIYTEDQATRTEPVFTPTSTGVATLRLTAFAPGLIGQGDSTYADAAVEIRDHRWSVLFYDLRASWLSTFVRRAIEGDDRITVTSRAVTSRNISTAAGSAPPSLDDATALSKFDAIVVGAPDALTDRDVNGLDAFMRKRGGSVVLLLDQRTSGPWQRLADAGTWADNGSGRATAVGLDPSIALLEGSEFAWPVHLPSGADVLAYSLPATKDTATKRPIVWRAPIGVGQLVVSGALDAWRYRDSTQSRFDSFWRTTIANAASAAPDPVIVTLSNNIVSPGEALTVRASLRDIALRPLPSRVEVGATLTSATGEATALTLWPDGSVGELTGTLRAPALPGIYRMVVTADGKRGEAALVVVAGAVHPVPNEAALVGAWATAHGGSAIPASDLQRLPGALRSAIHARLHPVRWHPMRSFWWLVPFALALSAEWWWRRRSGLA